MCDIGCAPAHKYAISGQIYHWASAAQRLCSVGQGAQTNRLAPPQRANSPLKGACPAAARRGHWDQSIWSRYDDGLLISTQK